MGTAKIYIASASVDVFGIIPTGKHHLYLIYDPDIDGDGDATTGSGVEIIRGGPTNTSTMNGSILVEVGVAESSSEDAFSGDSAADRNLTTLQSGSTATTLWNDMKSVAQGLGTYDSASQKSTISIDYYAVGTNSAGVIRAVLDAVGYDIDANLPLEGGSGPVMGSSKFPGLNAVMRINADGVYNTTDIPVGLGPAVIFDDGGADEYIIPFDRTTWIIEDNDVGTADEITISGMNMTDAMYQRRGDDLVILDGSKPIAIIKDHFAEGAAARPVATLNFDDGSVPTSGISPLAFTPQPLPGWVTGAAEMFHDGENALSPIVLDIDMSGSIDLAALNGAGSVYWDIDGDGFAEASGWIAGDDGLLCVDANSDGVITQDELFGNDATYANGYLKLDAFYDTNNDNAITSADTGFGDLRVWIDTNADGYSQAGELHTLASLGITSIASSYSDVNYQIAGNQISQQSTFTMNGNTYTSVDAWFSYDNVNSEYAGDYTLDVRTLFLPDLRGYGTLPDLHIAMSQDSTLLGLVQEIAVADASTLLSAEFGLYDRFEGLLYHWAGVEDVALGSRSYEAGLIFDARKLEFMEEFMDEDFWQTGISGGSANPANGPMSFLQFAWNEIVTNMMVGTLLQTDIASKVVTGGFYNAVTGAYEGTATLNMDGLQDIADAIALNNHNFQKISNWATIFKIMDTAIGLSNLSSPQIDDVMTIVHGSITGFNVSYADLVDMATGFGTTATTGDSNDNLLIGDANVWVSSPSFNLTGGAGNDILYSGMGADQLSGNAGGDMYVFRPGDGKDTVIESLSSGADTIVLSGYGPQDIRLRTDTGGSLLIENENSVNAYGPSDLITVYAGTSGGIYQSTIGQYIESIVFDDGTVWDLTGGLTMEVSVTGGNLYGTAFSDTLIGTASSNAIYGNGGNDIIAGGGGADFISGGDGDDLIIAALNTGGYFMTDYYYGDAGNDTVSFITATAGITVNLATLTKQDTGGFGYAVFYTIENIIGSAYNDTLTGDGNANILEGGSGNDALYGGAGNDVLYGGSGLDLLYGNEGADRYVFEEESAYANVDQVYTFSLTENDSLDVSDLLNLYDPLQHAITDFVQITTSGSNSSLFVDRDGTGAGYGFEQVATVYGVTGLTDEAGLVASGHLIVT